MPNDIENVLLEDLDKDEYYLFCEMMLLSLRTDNVIEGVNKSLFLLKKCLDSGDITLHVKNPTGVYVFDVADSELKTMDSLLYKYINYSSTLVERFGKYLVQTVDGQRALLSHLKTSNHDYILCIKDLKQTPNFDSLFFNKLSNVLEVILKRAESYETNVKAINTDLLTNLDNRNSYETRISSLDQEKSVLVYGLFDLFRLKYINDTFGHVYGDTYIKETAKILNKYWPKLNVRVVDFKEESTPTGSCVYRIGGDEFALITSEEPLDITISKAQLAAEEVKLIDLGLDEPVKLGLNFGIVEHQPGTSIKKTVNKADEIISEDKRNMYLSYGLDRRK